MYIGDYFPGELTPREGQKYVLSTIHKNYNDYDVFVIVAPTAAGKTQIAETLIKWQGSGTLLAPTKQIVTQLAKSTGFTTIRNKNTYKAGIHYTKARRSLQGGMCVLNYYQYIANKAYNKLLVVDEAHSLIEFLRDKEQVKLWGHLDGFEEGQFKTMTDVLEWLPSAPNTKRIVNLRSQLDANPDRFLLEETKAMYRGHSRTCLKLIPLTPRDNKPILWPEHRVNKIVLMSATFNDEDLFDLGLDRRRVLKLEVPSPIPVDRRPVKYWPVANMSFYNQATSVPVLCEWLEACLTQHKDKGFIHTTYSLANKLKKALDNDRILWHNRYNKEKVYEQWLNSDPAEGLVLVGCGMAEGISLDYDIARWQVITKVQYPNITDPAIAAKMVQRPDSYNWATIKQLVQAAGRVSRRVDDVGVTYLVDSSANRLFREGRHLFPNYFMEALEHV